jgi:hypothetical protein
MGRASGRKSTVPRQPVPGSPEGDEIGLSIRQDPGGSPIPGLTGNITNYETVKQKPATGDSSFDEFRGMMAHGVPNASELTEERALMERDGTLSKPHRPPTPPQHDAPPVKPTPIPVFVVEEAGGADVFLSSSPRHITVPSATGTVPADPVRICGRNPRRNRIGLLNEDTSANNIRFAQRPSDLVNGGGSMLFSSVTNYLWLETQDELFVLSATSGTPLLSIIEEFEQEL